MAYGTAALRSLSTPRSSWPGSSDCSTENGGRNRLFTPAWAAVGGRGRGIPASPEPAVATPGHCAAARRWSAAVTLRWAPGPPSLHYWREAQAGWLAEVTILPEDPRQLPTIGRRSLLNGMGMRGATCHLEKLGEFSGSDSQVPVKRSRHHRRSPDNAVNSCSGEHFPRCSACPTPYLRSPKRGPSAEWCGVVLTRSMERESR